MKGLERLFAEAFHKAANLRGFVILDENPAFGAFPLYKTDEWLIGATMYTGFPDTVVTITLTPQNPPPESSKQHLLKCQATWVEDKQCWRFMDQCHKTEDLIAIAFNQMKNAN